MTRMDTAAVGGSCTRQETVASQKQALGRRCQVCRPDQGTCCGNPPGRRPRRGPPLCSLGVLPASSCPEWTESGQPLLD